MLKLIQNEIYKTFKTKKIYVFMFIIFFYNFLPSLEQVMGTIDHAEILINGQSTPFYMLNFMIANIIPIFIIVSMADMITGEYVSGTLILPLLHPVSRTKLLTAKMIALFIPLIFLLVFSLILSYGMGTLIFGWGDYFSYQEPEQSLADATVYSTVDGILVTLGAYFVSIFPLVAFGMMVMFLALHLNSSGVTVGISIGLLIFFNILGAAVEPLIPFLIVNGFGLFKDIYVDQNLIQASRTVIITTIYGGIFFGASIYTFRKKDLIS